MSYICSSKTIDECDKNPNRFFIGIDGLTLNSDLAVHYSTIGEAFIACSKVNDSLGIHRFKVIHVD